MAKRIEYQELIDLDGFKRAIADTRSDQKAWTDEAIKLADQLQRAYLGVRNELEQLRKSNASTDDGAKQEEIARRAIVLTNQLKEQKAAYNGVQLAQQQQQVVAESLTARLEKLVTEYANLDQGTNKNRARANQLAKEMVSVRDQMEKLNKVTKTQVESTQEVTGTYNKLQKELTEAKKALKALDDSFDANTGKLNKNNAEAVRLTGIIQRNDKALKQIDGSLGMFGRNVGNYPKIMQSGFNGLLGILGQFGVAISFADALSGIVSVRAEYEKLGKQLEVTLGGKGAAAQAQKLITDFANKTPHDIQGVTSAFNRLVDIGIVPTQKQLFQLSDIAVAKGKTISDYVEAIADAQTGSYERLKEFSIDASKAGDKVTFTFKGQATTVANTATAIDNYLLSLGNVQGIAGQTEEAGKTLAGQWSTVKDSFKGVANEIGEILQPALQWMLETTQKAATGLQNYLGDLRAVAAERQKSGTGGGISAFFQSVFNPNQFSADATEAQIQANERAERQKQIQARRAARRGQNTDDSLEGVTARIAAQRKIGEAQAKAAASDAKYDKDKDKRQREADAKLKDSIETQKSLTNKQLADTEAAYKAGAITEIEYVNQRLTIQQDGIFKEQKLLVDAKKGKTKEYTDTETELTQIASDFLEKRKKIEEDAFKRAVEGVKNGIESDTAYLKNILTQRVADLQLAYNDEETSIKKLVSSRQISEAEGERRLFDLKIQLLKDIASANKANSETIQTIAQARIDKLEDQLRASGKSEIEIARAIEEECKLIEKERNDAAQAAADGRVRINEVENAKKQKNDEETQRKKDELIAKAAEVAIAGVSAYVEITNGFRDQEIANLEKQKDYELSLVGDNAEAKAAIEKKYSEQVKQIKRQQAIADKAAALFQIAISTAVNAAKVGIANPILFALTIALGALQAAVVAARPIPEFWRGTSDAPEGAAWVGERGYELIEGRQGNKPYYRLAAEKQVMYLNKHDRVFTHEESKRIINKREIERTLQVNSELTHEVRSAPGGSYHVANTVRGGITKEDMRQVMLETLGNQTVEQTVLSDGEMKKYIKKQQQHTQWLNSHFSLPRHKG